MQPDNYDMRLILNIDISRKLLQGIAMAAAILATLSLTGCFTGVERTDKISLSRGDRKLMRLTPEEKLLQNITGQQLKDWKPGKLFHVVDNKAMMVFDPEGTVPDTLATPVAGMRLRFKGSTIRRAFDGSEIALVTLTDGSRDYILNTAMTPEKASEEFIEHPHTDARRRRYSGHDRRLPQRAPGVVALQYILRRERSQGGPRQVRGLHGARR